MRRRGKKQTRSGRSRWLIGGYGMVFLVPTCFLIANGGADVSGFPVPEVPQWSAPATDAWFGKDQAGDGMLGKTLAALAVSAWAASLSCLAGGVLGTGILCGIARFLPERGYENIRRLIDMVFCLPALFLLLLFSVGAGPGFWRTVIAMTLLVAVFAVSRGCEWLSGLRSCGDVLAARALGAGRAQLVREHFFPRLLPKMAALVAILLPSVMVAESALSFAGFGLGSEILNAGRLIFEGREAMFEAPWLLFCPGASLWVLAVALGTLATAWQRMVREMVSDRLM